MYEKDIESFLTAQVKRLGGICFKFTSPGCAGVPDRIVLLPGGLVCFLEIKRPKQKARPLQEYWLKEIQKRGFLARSVSTRAEIIEVLNDLQTTQLPNSRD